ncbi:MAG: SIS domain-containing protein [Bifidobacterium tibiigranuli]|uniref:SIS domain-containing protein n=1 Tax=Bifidobacterium tibiigranuli TaxID=2172043 RepID=UPI0026EC48A8|nr:SIS domain-containing protein [Bifidobacterium tibiigranuli]MCI1674422.1 SIS domain-containing protein [Bifidobacterium tibiigranuli]MCI1713928.1 SIS domain-containing protein [Bifidobacterium tibiigranuli]
MTNAKRPGTFMQSEIIEQPQRWLDLLAQREAIDDVVRMINNVNPQFFVIAARGSSDHAGLYGQCLAHNILGVPTMFATPSSVTVYDAKLCYPRAAMLAVSQSGASPDLLSVASAARHAGVLTVALTNDPDSSLAMNSDTHVSLYAGPELSVAATKTYTAEMLALYLIFQRIAGVNWTHIDGDVRYVADKATELINRQDYAEALAATLTNSDRVMVIGRGYSYATAKEAALKLTETSGFAASGWSAADAMHGPIGQIHENTPVILLETGIRGRNSIEALGDKALALGAHVLRIRLPIDIEKTPESLVPLLEILPMQVAALRCALSCGRNPDSPIGLAKITQTV